MPEFRYKNRADAGRLLADALQAHGPNLEAVVLALPRGGVPVGALIAKELKLPLDVFLVRKIGVPGFEELAMGAIASGGVRVLNDDVLASIPEASAALDEATAAEMRELARREAEYRGDLPAINLLNRTAILVDDGLATGASMRAAVKAVRLLGAHTVIVAAAVGPLSTCELIRKEADRLVCPLESPHFESVGQFYADFAQTSDAEVCALLAEARTAMSLPRA